MPVNDYKPLRLAAEDADDLAVISACLQDAVAKVGDFAFLKRERRFAFVANRFAWETAMDRKRGPFLRVRAGVHFTDVLNVRSHNVRRDAPSAVVSILAIRFLPGEDGAGVIEIDLAGGGVVAVDVECLSAHMSDISDPWMTRSRPRHDDA